MSNTLIAAALVGVCAVIAAVYFAAKRGGELPSGAAREKTEPVFRNNSRAQSSATESSATKSAADSSAIKTAQPPSTELSAPIISQGTLPMEDFVAPDLPPPAENVLAADMCYVVYFYGKTAVAKSYFESLLKKLAQHDMAVFSLLAFSPSLQQWKPAADEKHENWLLAIPLADRGGAMNENKIKTLVEESRAFVEGKPLRAVFSSNMESLKNAALLDEFCNAVDRVIEMRLSGAAHAVARVDEVLRMNKLVKDGGGKKYVYRADSEVLFAARLLTVAGDDIQTIVFELDAPNVSDPPNAWEQMRRCAARVAAVLNLTVADPKGEVINDARMEEMRRQLTVLSKQMRDFGVAPGGAIARLLFS